LPTSTHPINGQQTHFEMNPIYLTYRFQLSIYYKGDLMAARTTVTLRPLHEHIINSIVVPLIFNSGGGKLIA